MQFALANLDTGLFLGRCGWTPDRRLAERFPDAKTVSKVAAEHDVKHAAAALLHGDPPQLAGFMWVTSWT
jgi:hypothetical protein